MSRSVEEIFARFPDRWPETGDQLISPSRALFLAEAADERNYRLVRGYKRAGDILIQSAYFDRADRANLIFPALFNYRHYIDLALKSIIYEYGHYVSVSLGKKNHKLLDLWAMFRAVAIKFGADASDPAAMAVESCINELNSIDTNSTTFRYATTLEGVVPTLPNDGIDLVRLHDVMNGIESFFESADQSFSHAIEMQAEYYSSITE